MRSIARDGVHEVEIQRSRFICSLAQVTDADQAAAFIADVRKQNWSATHNCSAFRVGPNGEQQRSSDDGEPAGTAGIPMLEVLVRRDLTNTAAVVTRHFGGIKLGAGGLVRAYGRAVAEAVDAVGTVRLVPHVKVQIDVDHAEAGKLDNELRSAGLHIADTEYRGRVSITVHIPLGETDAFQTWLAARTGGRSTALLGDTVIVGIPDS